MDSLIALLVQTPAASAILAMMVAASLWGLRHPGWIERELFRPYWLVPRGDYRTLFTSAFLHADLAHLLFNAFSFWAFAFALERTLGSTTFVALYFFGLLVSDAGTWLAHRDEPRYACLGASGAILAVLFASIAYHPRSSIYVLPLPVPIPAWLFALLYLGYSVYAARWRHDSVNHDAHVSGAVAGLVFVALTDFPTLELAVHRFLD